MELVDFYPLSGFKVTRVNRSPSGKVLIQAASSSRSAVCPDYQTRSYKRHSAYVRRPQALSCSDISIQLVLSVPWHFCQNPACEKRTFAERIPGTARFYARRTINLDFLLGCIGFEMSAEAVSRVCAQLGIQLSPDSMLRMLRATDISRQEAVRVLGVDDWAKKKGQNYGTILVDLEKHRTIELLPDRTQETMSNWLQKHPEIEIISRDRSFEYKAGIETGAPQAIQVVDRWHLLHNVSEKLREIIPGQLKKKKSEKQINETPTYQKRKKYFELVNDLHAQGYSQRLIARLLDLARGTVPRYIADAEVPDWQPRPARPN